MIQFFYVWETIYGYYYIIAVITIKITLLTIIILLCNYNHKYQTFFSQCLKLSLKMLKFLQHFYKRLSVLHNYFNSTAKLFADLYLT